MYFGAYTTRDSDACPECGKTYTAWSNARQGYYCPSHQKAKFDRFLDSGWFSIIVVLTWMGLLGGTAFAFVYIAAKIAKAV